MRRAPAFISACLLLVLAPLLGSCRYNYVPLIPPRAEVQMPPRVFGATLVREGDTLRLNARVEGDFSPGYLKVSWFAGRDLVAEDAVYLDADLREASFSLRAPDPAAYRAVLSLGGVVLRQVELYEVRP